jgi:glycosyltransferase involved in cell wall biosynthesis
MISISLCMIVKNEEETLSRCLDTVKDIVDEINIVDTGSTDRTKEIALKYTNRIFDYQWTNSFADARNESYKYATKDYILYLDADDIILEADQVKFKELKETLDPSVDSVSMYYDAGTDEFGNVTLRYRRNRLVKREKNFRWYGDCHNYLEVGGNILNSEIAITHKKLRHAVGRTVSIFEGKKQRGDVFSARDHFYYGNELRENGRYQEAIESYDKNLALTEGWVEDKIFACIFKGDCYRCVGDLPNELTSLFQSFRYACPRAEACSRIGYNFHRRREYKTAVFWYELATAQVPDPDRWSFIYLAYYTWYPHLQMCVCHYNMGNFQKAYEHNEAAARYRPTDPSVINNKNLFDKMLAEGKIHKIEKSADI